MGAMMRHPTYDIRERTVNDNTVIELSGELDLMASTELVACLDAVCEAVPSRLVLDLRRVTFLDCSGLALLCRIRNRLAGGRGQLLLVLDDTRHRRLLRLTGLSDTFDIVTDVATALTRTSPPGRSDTSADGGI
ncbi:STAS domain-containing protein [Streptomyces sporangiiformans]|uniref:Anti-sigma factor antagonist n=2 Tax=Streptomyces sporangiiformans TaxID=2315329 RepID=A0A505DR21_9ACTN|nr:STAS domain-containing protein [Streptomyces sporangiiformans]